MLTRLKLRQATLILPRTGERIKRAVTFREAEQRSGSSYDGSADNASYSLPRHRKQVAVKSSQSTQEKWKIALRHAWGIANSKVGSGVLKCSIAYVLGSLATFVPPIARFLGPQDGKHMVATVTVYFHPARSAGSMLEAMVLATAAFVYAVFICFASMGVSIFFGRTLDLLLAGHVVVLIVFCGGGLGFVGWIKQRLASPLVNISCSLTSLAIITVLTKEGAVQAAEFSDDKVIQVLKMIVMGVIASTLVCFAISPISARRELRAKIVDLTECFSLMITNITTGFLTGNEADLESDGFVKASDDAKSMLSSLPKMLQEARYEHFMFGTENFYNSEAKLAACMQQLAQKMGGLRSAATTQFNLLAQPLQGECTPHSPFKLQRLDSFASLNERLVSPKKKINDPGLDVIDESDEDEREQDLPSDGHYPRSQESVNRTPTDIFAQFIDHLGPSMKSLAYTLRQILDELPYAATPNLDININTHLNSSLDAALSLYQDARENAIQALYRQKGLYKAQSVEVEADYEEVAASCGQFSFSLQDLANEMKSYLEILEDLKLALENSHKKRTWRWLRFWQRWSPSTRGVSRKSGDPEFESLMDHNDDNDLPSTVPDPLERKSVSLAKEQSKVRRKLYWNFHLWRAMEPLRRDDVKFAIKVGIGAALYALPSFIVSTRPFYQHWRGEWGLLSYMLVCSMTKGASNTTGFARFLGTCIGAVCAIVAWTAAAENPYVLAFFGWFMSLWTAYIIIGMGKGPMGRFIMLTYNLSALYAYSLSVKDLEHDDDDDEGGISPIISEIALHRVVAVVSGCLWGLVVTRLIWPISARVKFTDGLSLLWLRMGLIWKRDPLTVLLDGHVSGDYMDLHEESDLHGFLARLENLRSSASSEFDIRGPFPESAYKRLLDRTELMLNAFHTMNVMILKDPEASKGVEEILEFTEQERAQLSSRISHLFQVLASSMKLEYPLDALPSISHSRDRLLAKVFQYRKEAEVASKAQEEDFSLLYAYALVTGQLAKELHEIGDEIEGLFGVLTEETLKLR